MTIRKWMAVLMTVCMLGISCGAAAESLSATPGIDVPVLDLNQKFDVPENEALAFVRDMRTGWNLGNTFDAFDYLSWFNGPESRMETAWVGAMTTPELMQAIKNAGFNTVRIPVSWHDHVDADYHISEGWLNRVRGVADYALNLGMYVIVNVHHDNSADFMYPDSAHYEQSAAYMSAIWQQMADKFADCDEHLILESMNEPRLVNTSNEWYWVEGNAACMDAADCINKLNQLFVDTVRATGGNNATRYLAVPAYDANPYYTCSDAFVLPKDTADNRIIVAAHAYTPYDFALNLGSKDSTFAPDMAKKTTEINQFLNQLYKKFVANGIPVMMDEYGALDKNGNLQDRVYFAAYYVAAASVRGITCCWWDNHAFSGNGELFGLINRKTCTWTYPDIVLAIQANCMYGRE